MQLELGWVALQNPLSTRVARRFLYSKDLEAALTQDA